MRWICSCISNRVAWRSFSSCRLLICVCVCWLVFRTLNNEATSSASGSLDLAASRSPPKLPTPMVDCCPIIAGFESLFFHMCE